MASTNTALATWRAVVEEAHARIENGAKYLMVTEAACVRLGGALEAAELSAHEQGVDATARHLRQILDGKPCVASEPPELAEVAARLAQPGGAATPDARPPAPTETTLMNMAEAAFADAMRCGVDQFVFYKLVSDVAKAFRAAQPS